MRKLILFVAAVLIFAGCSGSAFAFSEADKVLADMKVRQKAFLEKLERDTIFGLGCPMFC